MRVAVGLLALAVLTFVPPDDQQIFRSGVNVVELAVSVQVGGRPVTGLTAGNFIVRDRGVVQQLDDVIVEDVPLSVTLVPDLQEVVWEKSRQIENAVSAAAALLRPTDRLRVLTVNGAVREALPWSNGSSPVSISLEVGGIGVLYDGLALALVEASGAIPRPVVITLTNALDEASVTTLAHLAALAKVSDAVCFAVAPIEMRVDPIPNLSGLPDAVKDALTNRRKDEYDGRNELREMTRLTAGDFFEIDGSGAVAAGFARAIDAVRGSYVIRFRPNDLTAGWHDLDVRVNRGRYDVRARRGYMVPTPRK